MVVCSPGISRASWLRPTSNRLACRQSRVCQRPFDMRASGAGPPEHHPSQDRGPPFPCQGSTLAIPAHLVEVPTPRGIIRRPRCAGRSWVDRWRLTAPVACRRVWHPASALNPSSRRSGTSTDATRWRPSPSGTASASRGRGRGRLSGTPKPTRRRRRRRTTRTSSAARPTRPGKGTPWTLRGSAACTYRRRRPSTPCTTRTTGRRRRRGRSTLRIPGLDNRNIKLLVSLNIPSLEWPRRGRRGWADS